MTHLLHTQHKAVAWRRATVDRRWPAVTPLICARRRSYWPSLLLRVSLSTRRPRRQLCGGIAPLKQHITAHSHNVSRGDAVTANVFILTPQWNRTTDKYFATLTKVYTHQLFCSYKSHTPETMYYREIIWTDHCKYAMKQKYCLLSIAMESSVIY